MSWSDGFVIDRDPTLRKKPNCKDCFHYENEDRTCNKMGYRFGRDGDSLTSWQKCDYFDLEEGVDNYEEKKSKYDEWSEKHILQRKKQDQNAKSIITKASVPRNSEGVSNRRNNNMICSSKKKNQNAILSDEEIHNLKLVVLIDEQSIPKKCIMKNLIIKLENGKEKQIQLKIKDGNVFLKKGVYPEKYEILVIKKFRKT